MKTCVREDVGVCDSLYRAALQGIQDGFDQMCSKYRPGMVQGTQEGYTGWVQGMQDGHRVYRMGSTRCAASTGQVWYRVHRKGIGWVQGMHDGFREHRMGAGCTGKGMGVQKGYCQVHV